MLRAVPAIASVAVIASLLGACSGARFADIANLSDPRTIVDETIDGTAVTIRQGGALVIRLAAPSADGMQWSMQPIEPDGLKSPVRRDYAPDSGAATLPAIPPYDWVLAGLNPPGSAPPGGIPMRSWTPTPVVTSGANVFYLRGVTPGTAKVQLDYLRTGEPGVAPAKSVRFDVAVQ